MERLRQGGKKEKSRDDIKVRSQGAWMLAKNSSKCLAEELQFQKYCSFHARRLPL